MTMKYLIDSDGATDKSRLDAVERGMVQTSSGVLVFLDNNTGALAVKWTAGRTAVDGTLTTPTGVALGAPYSAVICRDASDNLYVFGISTTTNFIRGQAYTKGAGNTWTKQAANNSGNAAGSLGRAVWCNTGGGTGGAGHVLVFGTLPGLNSDQVFVYDAGAMLAGSAGAGSALTLFSASTGAPTTPDAAQDGFGATSGLAATWSLNSAVNSIFVDSWSVNSSGTVTLTHLTTQTTAVGTNPPRVVRYASNAYAVLYQSTTASGRYRCARYSSSAQLTAGTDSGAPTSLPLVSTSSRPLWSVQVDPNTANTLRLLAQDTAGKVWAVTLALGAGVTWGGTATAESGSEAGTQTQQLGLRAIENPDYAGTGFGDWQSRTNNAGSTNYLFSGDYHAYNVAPFAPTLTAPANGSTADLASGGTFSGTFADPDVGDTMAAYALRRKISGAGSYEYWNAGTSAWQAGIVWNSSATLSVTFGSGKWTNGNVYNWSFATQDAAGAQGPFAADNTVTAQVPPTVVVNAPTGTIATATPTVTWTDTLAPGATQTAYQVIVESGAYGTTPGSGTQKYDSTTVAGPALSRAIPGSAGLVSGSSYRFFVRVTQTGGQLGPWAYSTATVTLTPPTQPSLVATAQASSGRVKLDVTAGAGGPGGTTFLIERSDDGGTSWTYVRGASPLLPLTYASTVTVYDYEAPPSVALLYRVTTVLVAGGNVLYSTPSATAAATLALTAAWLKDPLDPSRNIELSCLAGITPTRQRAVNVLTPLGATYPVVQVDARRSRSFTVEVTPTTQAEADAVDELLDDTAAVLLLQRPAVDPTNWRGRSVYFVVSGDDTSAPLGDVPSDVTTLSFPVTEVATPALA